MAGAAELSSGTSHDVPRTRALTVVNTAAPVDAAPSRWQLRKPPNIALALTVAALALHALVLREAVPWAQSFALGVPMALAGFGWMAWAVWTLRQAGTPLPSSTRPTVLVDHGPYRFGRNPIYLGMVTTMLGLGLAAGVPLMAVAAANFVAIVASVHIPQEEANLKRAFGGWYSDYAASVRRWL